MMTPSLFGPEPGRSAIVRRANDTHPHAPWYDAFNKLLGKTVVSNSRARVGAIIKAMIAAGLFPQDVAAIPTVVARYAGWMGTVDIAAVQRCWPYLVDAPVTVSTRPSAFEMAARAIAANGGEEPF